MLSRRSILYGLQLVTASLSGYLLTRLVAYLWGTSQLAGAFEVAWSLPMLLITASGLNAMQAVTARYFSTLRNRDARNISDHLSSFLNLFSAITIVLSLLAIFFRHQIAVYAAPGLPPEMTALTADLIVILVPLTFFLGTSLFMGGVYVAFNVPITAEISLLLTRMASILAAVVLLIAGIGVSPEVLAWLLLGSGAISTLVSYRLARKQLGYKYRLTFTHAPAILSDIGPQSLAYIAVAILGQAIMVYYRSAFSLTATELIAAFSYAFMTTNTFSSIFGKISFFAMTSPSQEHFEKGNLDAYCRMIARNVGGYAAGSVLFSVVLFLLDDFVITVLFSGGRFDAASHAAVKGLFDILILSIPHTVLIWVLKVPRLPAAIGWSHLSARRPPG